MRLKYIELYGFKSFSEKTRFTFDKDFVCIVGPNGSGKSNTSDAIRWVLGEQSARALRGSKMEDVIFSGTEKRAPMNMAQVTIAFDNTDGMIQMPYDEIAVSRKVYRSGESEYLINKNVVRRKDIRELFMDTGIGKEGYSIIGQGRIEDILSSRSEDRRALFEEAAGIAKFKYQREESRRRLERTDQSLQEVVSELRVKTRQGEMLRVQAENAREGYKLTKALEQHELSLLKQNIERIEAKRRDAHAELEKAHIDQRDNAERLKSVSDQVAPYRERLDALSAQRNEALARLAELERKISGFNGDIAVKQEQLRFYGQDCERLKEAAVKRSGERTALEQVLKEQRREQDTAASELKRLAADQPMPESDTGESLSEIIDRIAMHQAEHQRISSELKLLDYDRDVKTRSDRALIELQSAQRYEMDQLVGERTALIAESETSRHEAESIDSRIESLNAGRTALNVSRDKAKQAMEACVAAINRAKQEQSALISSRRVMQTVYENFEGYYKSVQQFLKAAAHRPELSSRFVGVLADLIHVKSPYETAVDISLGSSLQNVVVRTEQDAKYLINYLKQNRLGRITFLPIDKIAGSAISRADSRYELINGAEAIECAPEIRAIIEHFLAKTSFVRHIDDAIALSHTGTRNRIVSLEGDVITGWGSMVGGSLAKKSAGSLINRTGQLEELDAELEKLERRIATLSDEHAAKMSELDALDASGAENDRTLRDAIDTRHGLDARMAQQALQIEHLSEKIRNLELALSKRTAFSEADYDQRREALVATRDGLDDTLSALFDQKSALEQAHQTAEKQAIIIRNEMDKRNELLQRLKAQRASSLARLDALDAQDEMDARTLSLLTEKIQSNERDVRDLEDQVRKAISERDALESGAAEREAQISAMTAEIEEALTLKAELDQEALELSKQIFRFETAVENASAQLDDAYEDYRSRYDLALETVIDRLNRLEPIETSRKKVAELKQALSKIGFFNFDSIEAYETLKEELDFLEHQLEDLHRSKADIETLIADLDKTMTQMFKESFEQINRKYDEIFGILFNGGHGKLLLDSGDVLSAGIDIAAQPPGKKLQSLDLLSGGERSMTALALLFAIFSIHPTPFCVLDEIDASLDEANIGRYINYLQTLTAMTQFIVITHRKTTMELADMLYGVTMQEGISRMVVLRFEDYTIEDESIGDNDV